MKSNLKHKIKIRAKMKKVIPQRLAIISRTFKYNFACKILKKFLLII